MKKFLSLILILLLIATGVYLLKPYFLSASKTCPSNKVPETIPAVPARSPCGEDGCPPYEPPTLQWHTPPAPVLTAPEDPEECPYMVIEPGEAPSDENKEEEPISPTFEASDVQSSSEAPISQEPISLTTDLENNSVEPEAPSEQTVVVEEPAKVEDPQETIAVASKVLPEDEPDYGSNEIEKNQKEAEVKKEETPTFASNPPEQDTQRKPRLRRLGYPPSE